MANERDNADDREFLDPEDVSSPPANASVPDRPADVPPIDPAAQVPVPPVMSPAEIDERAKVVEALREERAEERAPEPRRDDREPGEGMR